jgi:hypothetical protein
MWMGRYNALGSIDRAHPHGTAVAGAIVAHARLTGVAPKANILAIRALTRRTAPPRPPGLGVVQWRAHHQYELYRTARSLDRAKGGAGAPTGNCPDRSRPQCRSELGAALTPAAYPDVIAVTATDADD